MSSTCAPNGALIRSSVRASHSASAAPARFENEYANLEHVAFVRLIGAEG